MAPKKRKANDDEYIDAIDDYSGKEDVVRWLNRTEILCELQGSDIMRILPLKLKGDAFTVYAQLPARDRTSYESVKDALQSAFAPDPLGAYEEFVARKLRPGEAVDVFLADLRRLSTLFGGVSDRTLLCSFISGLPLYVREAIGASYRVQDLSIESALSSARRAVKNDPAMAAAAAGERLTRAQRNNHETTAEPSRAARRVTRRCWVCGEPNHLASRCPVRSGNGVGDGVSAPASSPAQ